MDKNKKTYNTDNSITKCIKKEESKKIYEKKKVYETQMFSKEELQVLLKLFP